MSEAIYLVYHLSRDINFVETNVEGGHYICPYVKQDKNDSGFFRSNPNVLLTILIIFEI